MSDESQNAPESAQDASVASHTSEGTSQEPVPAQEPHDGPTAPPRPPERTQDVRDENSPLLNEFVRVVDGPFAGRVGAFLSVVDFNHKTGFPYSVMVRTRDAANELVQVLYDHVRPHRTYKGGR